MKIGDKIKLKDSDSYLKEINKGVHPGIVYDVIQVTEDDGIKLEGISNYVCASNFVKVSGFEIGGKVICILNWNAPELKEYKELKSNKIYKIKDVFQDELFLVGVKQSVPMKFFKEFIPCHNDFLGNKLKIGDEVVYYSQNYRQFHKGIVEKFADKTVLVKSPSAGMGQIRQTSEQLIKIS